MSIVAYADGNKLGLAKDITNPNLIQKSDRFTLNGTPALGIFKMGKENKSVVAANSYNALWSPSGYDNWGEYHADTTFIELLPNKAYTFTLWLRTDTTVQDKVDAFFYNKSGIKKPYTLNKISLGNNEYKYFGTFITPNTDPSYCFLYLDANTLFADLTKSFTFCFERMKLEEGTESTAWIPAQEELATKSDLDDLKAQIEQLKSK